MRGFLSVMVVVCITVLAGLSTPPGSVYPPHPAGLGVTGVVLVPAGDDPGGH
jgi:hypothetical protein